MVAIQNIDAIKAVQDGARLGISQGYPQELDMRVTPVLDMTPDFHRKSTIIASNIRTTSGGAIAYTCSTTRKTFITYLNFSLNKNATCDLATGSVIIQAKVKNKGSVYLITLPTITLTAENQSRTVIFDNPIELEPGSDIDMSGTFTAGTMMRAWDIVGYETD